MESENSKADRPNDMPWFIVGRLQEFAGEERANVLRAIGIASFYALELINYYGLNLGFLELQPVADVDEKFHRAVTLLAVAWTMVALGILLCLRSRVFPASLKYISTGCDIILLTSILMVADGPRSPLVVGFFLVIVLSALRFRLGLIRFSALGSMAGYLFLSGYAKWFTDRDLRVPRYHQLIMLLALGLTGIVLGQVIRKVHGMAGEYVERLEDASETNE